MNFKQWLESQQVAKDKLGQEIIDLEGTPMYTNPDGTIDIYHATNKQSYDHIITTGTWIPARYETDVFFSNFPRGGEGFGDYVVHVKILPKFLLVNDAFRNGEVHLAVNHKILQKRGKIIAHQNSLKESQELYRHRGLTRALLLHSRNDTTPKYQGSWIEKYHAPIKCRLLEIL
jgi:hypothetical protein